MNKYNNLNSALLIEEIFRLMNIADNNSLDIIYDIIQNHPCELVRHEAIFSLGECISDRSIEILKKTLENDKSDVVKHECLMSLGTIGNQLDIKTITPYTKHNKFEISCSAKIAIDRINQINDYSDVKNKIDFYIEKLKDFNNTNQNERIQILFQLMNIADEKSIDAIAYILENDPCRIVRHEAAFVLGEIGNKKSINYMIQALQKEKTPIVIHETLFALGTTGNKNTIPTIKKFVDNKNYVISESAKIAIDRINKIKKPYQGKNYNQNFI